MSVYELSHDEREAIAALVRAEVAVHQAIIHLDRSEGRTESVKVARVIAERLNAMYGERADTREAFREFSGIAAELAP